ncbi:MAG: LysR substrate-binding domain-containing protein [Burkholderiaceae bacterium]
MKESAPKHSRGSLARRLRVQQLVVFEQVVHSGSILGASRELAMTQPAVSKSIRELEQQLDGVLFVRSKRGVVLTEFGVLFERHTQTLLGELRHLADDLNAWQTGASGHVNVGTLITASATLLPEAIMQLRKSVPDVVVTVRVGPNSVLFPALARGDLDVVVGFLPETGSADPGDVDRARLTHVALYKEALCVVLGSHDALARRRKIGLAELHEREWIVPTQDSVAYPSVRRFFEKQGLELPRRVVESVSILTNLGLLAGGSMVALMPQSAAERFAKAGLLTVLPLEGLGPFSDIGYTVRADRAPSAAVQRFLAALSQAGRAPQRRR